MVFVNYGFVTSAAASVKTLPCDIKGNTQRIIEKAAFLAKNGVSLAVFPELCVTGFTCGNNLSQRLVTDAAMNAVTEIAAATAEFGCVFAVGFPFTRGDFVYSGVAVLYGGKVLGVVPKRCISPVSPQSQSLFDDCPNSPENKTSAMGFLWRETLFGTNLVFCSNDDEFFTFAVESGRGVFSPVPFSTYLAASGANIIIDSAAYPKRVSSEIHLGNLITSHTKRTPCGYIFASAGEGESTSYDVYSGQNVIAEAGDIIASSRPFEFSDVIAEIDCEKIASLKSARHFSDKTNMNTNEFFLKIHFDLPKKATDQTGFRRKINAYPFLPTAEKTSAGGERWREILDIQAHALKKRLEALSARPVINVSGGLDSTLALIVCERATRLMGKQPLEIICLCLPAFGTTSRTLKNAKGICAALGVDYRVIDITNTLKSHLRDISHGGDIYDAAFENAQARERTQVAMDIANMEGGVMIGTGNMSELALGFTTYGGDHMSMYSVNAGLPKTAVRYVVEGFADSLPASPLKNVLLDICATPISPELLPPEKDKISQKTEDIIGPYPIHDFILYYHLKYAFPPKKIFFLAKAAFEGVYKVETIKKTFGVFFKRFLPSQYKRSCFPDYPIIGGVSFPRNGVYPSDAVNMLWEEQLTTLF